MILPEAVLYAIAKIEQAGFEAYAVGGCVRDNLLNKKPEDWDIATSALPEDIKRIFCGHPVIPTGIKHGTVTVIHNHMPMEVTTFRIDGSYEDRRHPTKVSFSKNLLEDLKRRDFTVNAMAYSPKRGLVDPFDGKKDLTAGLIRAVGEPARRFAEDALRIMRAIRFSAALDFKIDTATEAALFSCSQLLCEIAPERISAELNKILVTKNPHKIMTKYFSILAHRLFGNIKAEIKSPLPLSVFEPVSRVQQTLSTRLTAFLFSASQALNTALLPLAQDFFSQMKYDNKTRCQCLALLKNLHRPVPHDKISLRLFVRETGIATLQDLLNIQNALADSMQQLSDVKKAKVALAEIIRDGDCCHISQLQINGSHLISHFGLSGKDIGNALEFLLDAVIRNRCQNTREALLSYIKENPQ